MNTTEFCNKYSPNEMCEEGREFALSHETMSQVWDACEEPEWLFWMLEKCKPLEKEQSVRLSIAFAEKCLVNIPKGENRPKLAIEAARAWIENPCEETRSAASAAASAAWSAAWSAESAAWSTARSAASAARLEHCEMIREMIPNPFL